MKLCKACGIEKPAGEWYPSVGHRCKACHKARQKVYYHEVDKLKGDRVYTRSQRSRMMTDYGITPEEYQSMLDGQNWKCRICGCELADRGGSAANSACIDHCHDTGKVRGVLCNHCNRALGMFKDDIERILQAALYLEQARAIP